MIHKEKGPRCRGPYEWITKEIVGAFLLLTTREEELPGPLVAHATKRPYRPVGRLAAGDALLGRIWDF